MTGFFGWLKGVPGEIWAALGALAVVLGIIAKERHDAKMDERRDAEIKTRKVVDKIEKESANDADKADAARSSAPRVSDAAGVSASTADRIFRD